MEKNMMFTTILASRPNDSRPSDLEFLLRSHCQKLRVLEKLHGNAHLLIPKVEGCSTSLAMRVYHECDVSSSSNNTHNNFDTDCLQHFFQSFQLAVVFFILPTGKTQQAQLDDPNSSFHCAQRLADMESTNPSSDKNLRILLAPTPELALESLFCMVQGLTKSHIRQAYFDEQRIRHCLPPLSNDEKKTPDSNQHFAASTLVAEALRKWGERFDLPNGEVNVLMSLLGNLTNIVTAGPEVLAELPVEDRTKRLLQAFFGPDRGLQPTDQEGFHSPQEVWDVYCHAQPNTSMVIDETTPETIISPTPTSGAFQYRIQEGEVPTTSVPILRQEMPFEISEQHTFLHSSSYPSHSLRTTPFIVQGQYCTSNYPPYYQTQTYPQYH